MQKSIPAVLVATILAGGLMMGCQQKFKQIELRSPKDPGGADKSAKYQKKVGWEDLVPEGTPKPETQPRFISASEAGEAPELDLQRFNGQDLRVNPERTGQVTAVVFWAMDTANNRAAVMYIAQLVRKYRRKGLRAISIVEKPPTNSHRSAPKFLRSHGIDLPTYYDEFDALQEMADAAGASIEQQVPVTFLIDQQGRVRLFKLGFSYSGAGARTGPRRRPKLTENAPPGKGLEDYIQRLLKEE